MIKLYPELREVVVNCKTDTVFKGVVYKRTPKYIIMKNVQLLQQAGEALKIDGEVMIDRANVDFIQVLG